MPGGIDYSKWDRMDYSSDDDDDEDDGGNNSGPRVTRLDQPSQVTVSSTGEISVAKRTATAATKSHAVKKSLPSSHVSTPTPTPTTLTKSNKTSSSSTTPSTPSGLPAAWTEKGGSCTFKGTTTNTEVVWTQDRESVTLRVLIPDQRSTKGWKVQVEGVLKYADRKTAVSTDTKPRLRISQSQKPNNIETGGTYDDDLFVLLDANLPHQVHGAQDKQDDDDDADDFGDWSIERSQTNDDNSDTNISKAYMTVNLRKAAPMHGVVVWWNRPLDSADEIAMDWRTESTAASNFQQAWDEAHKQFREKMSVNKNNDAAA